MDGLAVSSSFLQNNAFKTVLLDCTNLLPTFISKSLHSINFYIGQLCEQLVITLLIVIVNHRYKSGFHTIQLHSQNQSNHHVKFKWVIAWLWRGPKCLPGWFEALITINTVFWQSCSIRSENKVPQSARLTEGGGAIAIWAMPLWTWRHFRGGFPYLPSLKSILLILLAHSHTAPCICIT